MTAPPPLPDHPARRVELWLSDAVLGAAILGAVSWMIYADLAGDRPPGALAYGWAFVLGALMMVRRRFPLAVLAVTIIGLFAYYAAGYPAIGLGVPLAGALLSAAQYRNLRWSVSTATVTLAVAYGVRLAQGQDFGRIIGFEIVGEVGTVAAAIALGYSLRLRSELQESTRRLIASAAEEVRARAAEAASEERASIARELHDSLGHHATVTSMHADVIREASETNPEAVRESAQVVKTTSGEMLAELRRTVRTLRGAHAAEVRQIPSLDADRLRTDVFDSLPLQVHAEINLEDPPPEAVQAAAHRILQEALTNVARHSDAEEATVRVLTVGPDLHLSITDPGPARTASGTVQGYGIAGMRERAESLGGSLNARPDGQGFTVNALLPIRRPEEAS